MQKKDLPRSVKPGTRIVAFLWDYIIISGYIMLLIGISYLAQPLLVPLFTKSPLIAEITGFLFLTLPVYLYFAISEGAASHATWGKRKRGIVVIGVNGQPIGIGRSLIRSALKFLPWELAHFTVWHMVIPTGYPDAAIYSLLAVVYGLVLVNLLCAFVSKNKQTVYDMMAGTVVSSRDERFAASK